MKKSAEKNKNLLVWRIVFGVVLIIFSIISLARFNATAALFYIIISAFIFIPGRVFRINNKWIKVAIVVVAIFGVGLFNHFYINTDIGQNNSGESTIIHKDFRAIMNTGWEEYEIPPSTFVYLPSDTSQDDVNAEVISIVVNYLGENNNYTLEWLLEQGIEYTKEVMPGFELKENTEDEILNMSVRKIKFTGTQEGIDRNYIQIFGIKYNNVYAITYSCPVDNCNSYTIYDDLVESFEPVEAELK